MKNSKFILSLLICKLDKIFVSWGTFEHKMYFLTRGGTVKCKKNKRKGLNFDGFLFQVGESLK